MANKESKELVIPEGTLHMLPFSDWDRWIEDVMRRPFSIFTQPFMRISPTEEIIPSVRPLHNP